MFIEWSSTKHTCFVVTSEFYWLPWQPKVKICKKKNIKKNKHPRNWPLNNYCFYCSCLSTLDAMATLNFHRCILGKMNISIYCYFIADILQKFFRNVFLEMFLNDTLPYNFGKKFPF